MSTLDDILAPKPAEPEPPKVRATAYSVQWFAWPRIVTTASHTDIIEARRDRDARQAEELPIAEGGARWVIIKHELLE